MFFLVIYERKVLRLSLVVYFIFLFLKCGLGSFPICPARELRARLQPELSNSSKVFCDCTTETRESAPSWEIMCFNDAHYSQPETVIDLDSDQYASLPVLFTIKYVYSSYVEIYCYERSPKFHPAMFQGFQIEEIDSFHVINCTLPEVPFNLIFHRIAIHTHKESPQPSDANIGASKKGNRGSIGSKVKGIRALKLKRETPIKVDIEQFQKLFLGLDKLEQLILENYQLYVGNEKPRVLRKREVKSTLETSRTKYMRQFKRSSSLYSSSSSSSSSSLSSSEIIAPFNQPELTTANPPTSLPLLSSTSNSFTSTDDKFYFNHESPTSDSISKNNSFSRSVMDVDLMVNKHKDIKSTSSGAVIVTHNENDEEISNKKQDQAVRIPGDKPQPLKPEVPSVMNSGNVLEKDADDMHLANSDVRMADDRSTSRVKSLQLNFSFGLDFPNLKSLVLYSFLVTRSIDNPTVLRILLSNLNSLENLDLKSNQLRHLPGDLFSGSGRKLKRLYLMLNSIESLHPLCFKNLDQVEILDLSNNRIRFLPDILLQDMINLKHLRVKGNQFISLPATLFARNHQLAALDISSNHNLTRLPVDLLKGLHLLRELTISDCNMNEFTSEPSRFLQYATNLEEVRLQNNRLTNLTHAHLFGFNSKLTYLDLSYNRINQIDADIFNENSSNLLHLNLFSNDIAHIPDKLLYHLKNLKTLNLGNNNLETINTNIFFTLFNLEVLDLSRNRLVSVNPTSSRTPFGLGSYLKKINLAHNNLTDFNIEIGSIQWDLHVAIEEINLSHNRLQAQVKIPIFFSTQFKVVLDLRNNLIETVKIDNILSHEKNTIEILGTSKSYADSEINTSDVKVLIAGNPFNCDCNLYPLIKYARSNTLAKYENLIEKVSFDISSDDLKCAEPPWLAKKSFYEVSPSDLICSLNSSRMCPHTCGCMYRAHDERVLVNCQMKNLTRIPRQLADIRNFHNISLPGNKSISHVRGVTLLMQHNKIKDLQPLESLLMSVPSQGSDKKSRTNQQKHNLQARNIYPTISFDLYFDNNTITTLSPSLTRILKYGTEAFDGDIAVSEHESTFRTLPSSMTSLSLSSVLNSSSANPSSPKNAIINLLSLRYNSLHAVPAQFLNDLRELQTITTDDSQIKPRVIKLYLGNNPYNCTPESIARPGEKPFCQMREFKSWLTSNYRIIGDIDDISCEFVNYNSSSALIKIPDSILCPQLLNEDQTLLLTITGICVVLALCLLMVSVLYYRNKQTVLAFFYIHLNPIFVCFNFHQDDIDEDKIYDAFVSYSSADRDIVMQLIEKLEEPSSVSNISISYLQSQSGLPSIHEGNYDQIVPEVNPEIKVPEKSRPSNLNIGNGVMVGGRGDFLAGHADSHHNQNIASNNSSSVDPANQQYFKLCIHERDWLPGNLISWNIVNSVQNSRRTIIILSKDFIQSIWFQVEFHTAYYQMLEDKIDRLIVIVRGDLPPKEELDKDLVFLLTTKTYLVWGEKWFWEKLRYALPHKKSRKHEKTPRNNINKSLFSKNAINYLKSGKDHHGKSKSPSKSEMMKEYVDQAIANHFQLNCASNGYVASYKSSNQASIVYSSEQTGNAPSDEGGGKKGEGRIKKDSEKVRPQDGQSKNNSKHGHINESFVIETET